MLPSNKRLSRAEFDLFLSYKEGKTVFNKLGTLKYQKTLENRASVVISSKHQKSAVKRNKLRRRIYSLFADFFKNTKESNNYVLYTSKQASDLSFEDTKALFHEIIKKTTK